MRDKVAFEWNAFSDALGSFLVFLSSEGSVSQENQPGINNEELSNSSPLQSTISTDTGSGFRDIRPNESDSSTISLNESPSNFSILDVVEKTSDALKEGYVTIVRQAVEYVKFIESQAGPILDLLGLSDAITNVLLELPEGPRTPSTRNDNIGITLDGDQNTMKFERYDEIALMASLSERGDPSEPNPDSNDLPGRVEVELLGLKAGANFQNGVYLGDYRPESLENEGHHQFQTGMVDQSGAYFADSRIDSLAILSLNPEAEGADPILGQLPDSLSIEALGQSLGGNSGADDLQQGDTSNSDVISRPEAISLFESLGLNSDYLGDLVEEVAEEDFSMPENIEFVEILPTDDFSSMLPILEVEGLFENSVGFLDLQADNSSSSITTVPSALISGISSILDRSDSV